MAATISATSNQQPATSNQQPATKLSVTNTAENRFIQRKTINAINLRKIEVVPTGTFPFPKGTRIFIPMTQAGNYQINAGNKTGVLKGVKPVSYVMFEANGNGGFEAGQISSENIKKYNLNKLVNGNSCDVIVASSTGKNIDFELNLEGGEVQQNTNQNESLSDNFYTASINELCDKKITWRESRPQRSNSPSEQPAKLKTQKTANADVAKKAVPSSITITPLAECRQSQEDFKEGEVADIPHESLLVPNEIPSELRTSSNLEKDVLRISTQAQLDARERDTQRKDEKKAADEQRDKLKSAEELASKQNASTDQFRRREAPFPTNRLIVERVTDHLKPGSLPLAVSSAPLLRP